MAKGPAKGEHTPLQHSLKARQRIVAAINWDPREVQGGLMDRLRGTHYQHDMDISCFVYDEQNEYIDYVGPAMEDAMDQTGSIYHSGDDQTGEGELDDEFITLELANLPDDDASIFFVVEIRTKNTFADILNPSARLFDGMGNHNLLEVDLAGQAANGKSAFVFARIYRDASSPTGWMLHHIGDFPDLADVGDWGSYLKKYF